MNTQRAVLAASGIGKTVKSGGDDLVILREIDFSVTPGEAVAIVGASGSGKSTLLAILAGLDTPTAGSVRIEGERLGHYPRHLSGGEQQRVALARAFVTQPRLLLADEPTGSLDAESGEAVIKLMFELNAQYGTTLVMVTHDEQLAARCDRSVRIAGGRILAPAAPTRAQAA
jgi:predicted ABC-type transport system involved in lysophospholipase L1 biosynthesis ATPase subunit